MDGKKRLLKILMFSTERHLWGWGLLKQGRGNLVRKLLWSIFCKLFSSEPRKGTPICPALQELPGSQQSSCCGQNNPWRLWENLKQGTLAAQGFYLAWKISQIVLWFLWLVVLYICMHLCSLGYPEATMLVRPSVSPAQ